MHIHRTFLSPHTHMHTHIYTQFQRDYKEKEEEPRTGRVASSVRLAKHRERTSIHFNGLGSTEWIITLVLFLQS